VKTAEFRMRKESSEIILKCIILWTLILWTLLEDPNHMILKLANQIFTMCNRWHIQRSSNNSTKDKLF
jgi:hypothetical protein